MARSSAVPRTLKLFRDQGFIVDVVEQYNAFSGQRKDYLGFIDLLAIDDQHVIGVQVCGADVSEHIRKMTTEREALVKAWLRGPFREVILIGWRKVLKKRGGKQKVFKPRIIHFHLGHMNPGSLKHREIKDAKGEEIRQIITELYRP